MNSQQVLQSRGFSIIDGERWTLCFYVTAPKPELEQGCSSDAGLM